VLQRPLTAADHERYTAGVICGDATEDLSVDVRVRYVRLIGETAL
jgi:hypothetical protein